MKTQITKTNAYILGTFEEIGGAVAEMLRFDAKAGRKFRWPEFAFAVADEIYQHCVTPEDVCHSSTGWYGMELVKNNFDFDTTATVIANYYGGGNAVALNLWLDEIDSYEECTANAIASAMKRSMEMQETVNEHTVLVAEWKIEDYIDTYEIVETCPHCDHENTYTTKELVNDYTARCKKCGRLIMICSECEFQLDCRWHKIPGGCECHRGKIIDTFIKS